MEHRVHRLSRLSRGCGSGFAALGYTERIAVQGKIVCHESHRT
jgi:hypothetical protein